MCILNLIICNSIKDITKQTPDLGNVNEHADIVHERKMLSSSAK